MLLKVILKTIFVLFIPLSSFALSISGEIIKPDSTPLESSSVDIQLELLANNQTCILYREIHSGINLTGMKGNFGQELGAGSPAFLTNSILVSAFSNSSANLSCEGSGPYNPSASDARYIRVSFKDNNEGSPVYRTISPNLKITSMAWSYESKTSDASKDSLKLGGVLASAYALYPGAACAGVIGFNGTSLTCTPIATLAVDWTSVINKPSTFAPTAHTHIVDEISSASGKYFSYKPNNVACATNELLKYDGTNWVCGTAAASGISALTGDVTASGTGSVTATIVQVGSKTAAQIATAVNDIATAPTTYVAKTGSTMSGALDMGGQNLTNTGFITMNANKSLHLSNNSSAPGGLTSADKGKMWFNITSGKVEYWDGAAVITTGAAGSANEITSLVSTGIVQRTGPGAFSTITVNAPLTYAANNLGVTVGTVAGSVAAGDDSRFASISGALQKTGGTMTGAIAMGNNDISSTGNISMAPNKYFGLSNNTADGTITGQMWYDAGFIQYFDGTATQSLLTDNDVFAGDIGGTYDANIVNKIKGKTVSVPSAAGQFMVYDGASAWNNVTLNGDASMTAAGAVSLSNSGTAGTYTKITVDSKGRATGGTNINASDVTTALTYTPLNIAGGTMSGALSMGNNDISSAGNISFGAGKYLKLTNTATNGSFPGQIWYDAGSVKYWNGSSAITLSAGTGISTLNGLSSGAQTFGIAATGTSPSWSSGGAIHTLEIPMAATAGVTAGLISKSDYDIFNNKLSSGSAFVGDVGGTFNTTSVDKIKGKSVVPTGYASNQFLKYDGTNWVNTLINGASDITGIIPVPNGGTGVSSIGSGNLVVGGGAGSVTSLNSGLAGNVVYATGASSWATGTPDVAGLVDKSSTQTISGAKAFTNYIQMAAANEIRFADSDSSNYVGFKSAGVVAANKIWTLPAADGTANQVLKTDGAGNLDWISPGGGAGDFKADGSVNMTGTLKANTGTAALPGLTFGSNTGTGVSAQTFDTLVLSTAGINRLHINATGAVGIGTTAPGSALDVKGAIRMSGATSGYAGFQPAASAGSTVWTLPTTDGSTNQVLKTDGAGNLSWMTPGGGGTVVNVATGAGLTGGPISSSGTISLTNTGVTPGVYTNITVDAQGRLTAASAISSGTITTILGFTPLNPAGGSMTGQLTGPAGTAALPSYSFNANTNTGMFSPSANFIGFSSNGTERMRITPSGIGIGTTTPSAALDIFGTTRTSNLELKASVSGILGLNVPSSFSNYNITLPGFQGAAGQTLVNNGSGILSWASPTISSAEIADNSISGIDLNFSGANSASAGFIVNDNSGGFYKFQCTMGQIANWTATGWACLTPTLEDVNKTANTLVKRDGAGSVSVNQLNLFGTANMTIRTLASAAYSVIFPAGTPANNSILLMTNGGNIIYEPIAPTYPVVTLITGGSNPNFSNAIPTSPVGTMALPRYWKNNLSSTVFIDGAISFSGTPNPGNCAFTLDPTYRPANALAFPVATDNGTCVAYVAFNGCVSLATSCASAAWASFDGISLQATH